LLGGVAMSTRIEIKSDLIKKIGQIPLMLRNAPFGRCLGAFAKPIAAACQGHAQSSRSTGSRLKWSKKFKDDAKFQNDSRQHFSHKVFKGGAGVVIGATFWKGNKQQFVMPYKKGESYTRYHWGAPGSPVIYTGRSGRQYTRINNSKATVATFPKEQRAPMRAYRQTSFAAKAAFLGQLQKEIKELRIG
jgi:hypothetical protein